MKLKIEETGIFDISKAEILVIKRYRIIYKFK